MNEMSDVQFAVWFAGAAELGWAPNPGSDREVDDTWHAHLPGSPPMSALIRQQAQVASSMIDAVLALVFGEQEARLHHTLLPEAALARAAVECLGIGLWLLLPGDEEDRRQRYLRYSLQDMANREAFSQTLDPSSSTGAQPLWKEGQAALTGVGLLPPKTPLPTLTGILKEIDAVLSTHATLDWRFLSGLAHGRPWAVSVWNDTTPADRIALDQSATVSRGLGLLKLPVGMARRYLEVADLRRRFSGPTTLEAERLRRISSQDQ